MANMLRPVFYFCGLLVFAVLIYTSLTLYSLSPHVDGWPVYHRLMQYMNGDIGLLSYLLQPHGSHPHSIVYALYLADLAFGGRQILPHVISIIFTAMTAILVAWLLWDATRHKVSTFAADLAAIGGLLIVPTLSTELLFPFQVVLTSTRLFYIAIIVAFVVVLQQGRERSDICLLIVACIATTFHGAGLMLGLVVLVQHLYLARTHVMRIAGATPLITSVLYTATALPGGAGELSGFLAWLQNLSIQGIAQAVIATFAYYASPISLLAISPSERWLTIPIAGIVALVSGFWALSVFFRRRAQRTSELALAFVIMFVALTAISAAVAFESRRILGQSGNYMNLADTGRYTALAATAYAVALVPLLTVLPKVRSIGGLISFSIVIMLVYCSAAAVSQRQSFSDAVNRSMTAVFAGADVREEPASLLWPGVEADWFWPDALSNLFDYMQNEQIGYAYGLPPMGSDIRNEWQVRLGGLDIQPTAAEDLCSIAGTVAPIDRDLLQRPQILALAGTDNIVIGAIALSTTGEDRAFGYMRCESGVVDPDPKVVVSVLQVR